MGSGYFDPGAYDDHVRAKAASGKSTFDYSDSLTPGARVVHPDLDPRWRNTAGLKVRESRDSAEHPDSTPIVVVLDVTGTMSNVVGAIHSSLKNLYNLLLTKGYVQHPQIMFMAIGDSVITSGRMCDEVPLQVGQFESDLRATLQLENDGHRGRRRRPEERVVPERRLLPGRAHRPRRLGAPRARRGTSTSSATSCPGRTSTRRRSSR